MFDVDPTRREGIACVARPPSRAWLSVYRRYATADEGMLRDAAEKLAGLHLKGAKQPLLTEPKQTK